MDPSNAQSVEEQNRRLARQYTEMAQLVGGLAHEIKNPLSTIRLNLELLAEEFGDEPTPRERRALKRMEVMGSECVRLQGLLDDFLNFAKVRQVRFEPSDLNAIIEEVLDFFSAQASDADVDIIRYLDPELPRVMLDVETFRGALLNLLLNAQQAMPDGGQLVIRTREHRDWVWLQLIDTGVGMDNRTASKIFDPFFSTKPGGSGLGLPLAARIIESHGGRITIQSELGQGTQFTIELPLPQRLTESQIETSAAVEAENGRDGQPDGTDSVDTTSAPP